MQQNKLPIGYWIKQADELLTTKIDEIHASFGLTRTAWQILNTIGDRELIERSELADFMSVFVHAKPLDDIIETLQTSGLVKEHEHKLSLTEKGKDQYSACFEKQKIFRQRAMSGISEEEYKVTVLTLQAIVENIK